MKPLAVHNVLVLLIDVLAALLYLAVRFHRNCYSWLPILLLIGFLVLPGCSYFYRPSVHLRHTLKTTKESPKYQHSQVGKASWYGPGFQGKQTASGEIFDQNKLTAGSLSLPLGTVVEVTNLKNRRKVEVKINDRGPYVKGRTLDLSQAAAAKLGMMQTGVAPVKIKIKSIKYKRPYRHRYRYRKHRR
jgi:rare lipoprotein A